MRLILRLIFRGYESPPFNISLEPFILVCMWTSKDNFGAGVDIYGFCMVSTFCFDHFSLILHHLKVYIYAYESHICIGLHFRIIGCLSWVLHEFWVHYTWFEDLEFGHGGSRRARRAKDGILGELKLVMVRTAKNNKMELKIQQFQVCSPAVPSGQLTAGLGR